MSKKNSQTRGFTLVEMLLSISILVVLLLLMAQFTNNANHIITGSSKHMEADKSARMIFDRMAWDFSRMLIRSDITSFSFDKDAGNDSIVFASMINGAYSSSPPPSARREIALIGYGCTLTGTFQRLAQGGGWEKTDTYIPSYSGTVSSFSTSGTNFVQPLSNQVFRFEYSFLMKGGTLSITPPTSSTISNVAAVVVGLAVMDQKSLAQLSNPNWGALAARFSDAKAGEEILGNAAGTSGWNKDLADVITNPPSGFTRQSVSGIRLYQRYFYIAQ